ARQPRSCLRSIGYGARHTCRMGRDVSNRRKGKKQPDWISVYRLTFKSAAWEALSVGARAVYVEFAANYNTRMENAVYLSARTGAKRLNVDKSTIVKWMRELRHYGLI